MRIRFRADDLAGAKALRVHVERRLALALSRFGGRIEVVLVRFSESAGARTAADKRCRLELTLRLAKTVSVEDTDTDPFVAVDRAVDRAARTVSRMLEMENGGEPAPPPRRRGRGASRA